MGVFTLVAQQTEQVASNHKVVGAIPTKGTKGTKVLLVNGRLVCLTPMTVVLLLVV